VRLPIEAARRWLARPVVVLALLATLAPAVSATESAPPQGNPTEAQVKAAVAGLAQDPNLGKQEKSHRLRWKSRTGEQPANNEPGSAWLKWLADALSWFATTARALLWVIGILLAGILGLHIKRFLELRGGGPSAIRLAMPTHVRHLDIRPESLPDDIGAGALGLWERGERRAGLALLYRGVLSRLAHGHGVPIRDASTEGDCLRLADSHLPVGPAAYVTRLIRVWQRAVYGKVDPADDEMRALCRGFADALDKPASPPAEQAA
jgi:uncharacterized protein DUF4129